MSTVSTSRAFLSPPVMVAIRQKHSLFPQLEPVTHAATPSTSTGACGTKSRDGVIPQPALGRGARDVSPLRSVRTYISQPG